VDAHLQTQISMAALACSAVALFFSLLAAFPGLKDLLAAVRDGVLWLALILVLSGVGFIVWQHVQRQPPVGVASENRSEQPGSHP